MKDNKYLMAIVGILAGLMCGLFGVGILLAAYVSLQIRQMSSRLI